MRQTAAVFERPNTDFEPRCNPRKIRQLPFRVIFSRFGATRAERRRPYLSAAVISKIGRKLALFLLAAGLGGRVRSVRRRFSGDGS